METLKLIWGQFIENTYIGKQWMFTIDVPTVQFKLFGKKNKRIQRKIEGIKKI